MASIKPVDEEPWFDKWLSKTIGMIEDVGRAADHITILGIKGNFANYATLEEFPVLLQKIQDAIKRNKIRGVSWDMIEDRRVDIKQFPGIVNEAKGKHYVVVASCPSQLFDEVRRIMGDNFNVREAWGRSDEYVNSSKPQQPHVEEEKDSGFRVIAVPKNPSGWFASKKFDEDLQKVVEQHNRREPLGVVYLNGCSPKLNDQSIRTVVELIKYDQTITKLDLHYNSIGDEGAKALADALKSNKTITEIDLRNNSIGDEGAKALADALKSNKTITWIDLSCNSIGDEGAKALADALKSNKTLTWIYLYSNSIGDEGAKALADALKSNKTITKIGLYSNSIGDQMKKSLKQQDNRLEL